MDSVKKQELLSLSPEELKSALVDLGEPSYRAKQLFSQLHKGLSPEEMTNIGKGTKALLSEHFTYHLPQIEQKLVSSIDGTVKYLFSLADGNCVESVVMKYEHGNTICLSSQVGCRMGCKFCASTIGGKVRDLTAGELLGQVIAAAKDLSVRIDGIVLMGIGEPLDNYDNVLKFLHLVGDPEGLNIGYRHISLSTCGLVDKIKRLQTENLPITLSISLRHISLSTCGLVDKIKRLQTENLPITLSISLHAPDDETRSAIMPVNKRWGVSTLLDACRDYFRATGRRISFEYTLIAGKNDSVAQAEKLASVLNSHLRSRTETMPIHVNLIPVNEVKESGFVKSNAKAVAAFQKTLEARGIRATVRRKLGADIDASCGQLRRSALQKNGE